MHCLLLCFIKSIIIVDVFLHLMLERGLSLTENKIIEIRKKTVRLESNCVVVIIAVAFLKHAAIALV